MLSDRLLRAAAFSLMALAATVTLSSCQIRPLYGGVEGQALNAKMHQLAFNTPTTTAAQNVLNELIFLTGGGQGESLDPKYDVSITAVASTSEFFQDDTSNTSSSAKTVVRADYSMRRRSDSKLLASGRQRGTAQLDFPRQEFAKMRAIRDAEQRAARQAAEQIYNQLAIALNDEPPEKLPAAPVKAVK